MRKRQRLLEISASDELSLIAAARDMQPVSGLTHNFYRYPARFSPTFVRAVISAFSSTGDLVLDPFMGGGTTLVEALALGRNSVGSDISALAAFTASVKTRRFKPKELDLLSSWVERLHRAVNIHRHTIHFENFFSAGYYKHLDHRSRWRLRKAIEQALGSAIRLGPSLEDFGRCVVLRTAQWALDGRSQLPPISEFRHRLVENGRDMIVGARELGAAINRHSQKVSTLVLNRSAAGLEMDLRVTPLPAPKLVLTSPPYPRVHVLYHRWQVDGRKEAPAPFWIANKLDGAGSSYYTMGDRKYPKLETYFENLIQTMSSVAALIDERTIVVQMVAFSDASWQLPRYLDVMHEVGFEEAFLPSQKDRREKRLWRSGIPRTVAGQFFRH
jgi:hypothetical protein